MIRDYLKSLLIERRFCWVVTKLRFWYFLKIKKSLKVLNSDHAFDATIDHNLKSLGQRNNRMLLLIRPSLVIEKLPKESKVLVIGPRNEYDLLTLVGYGVAWKNIKGLDLISYSSHIDLGDMHDMPYVDNTWDLIISGWALSYSAHPQKAASEMLRVAKTGGILAIGIEYSDADAGDVEALLGYSIQDYARLPRRINSVEEILALFEGHVGEIYFRHNAPMKRSHSRDGFVQDVSNIAVIFGVNKN